MKGAAVIDEKRVEIPPAHLLWAKTRSLVFDSISDLGQRSSGHNHAGNAVYEQTQVIRLTDERECACVREETKAKTRK